MLVQGECSIGRSSKDSLHRPEFLGKTLAPLKFINGEEKFRWRQ